MQHDDDARAGESGHGPEGIETRAERTASRHVVRVPGRWAVFFGPARASVDDRPKVLRRAQRVAVVTTL